MRQSVFSVVMVTVGLVVVAATTNSRQPEKIVASSAGPSSQEQPGGIAGSKAEVLAMTLQWKGERFADGRPNLSCAVLKKRLRFLRIPARRFCKTRLFSGSGNPLRAV